MRILTFKPLAKSVEFDEDMFWVELIDGRKLGMPLASFPLKWFRHRTQKLQQR